MKTPQAAGPSWGSRSGQSNTWPTVVFPATGVLPGYLGNVLAVSMDMQKGRPVNVVRYEGDDMPQRALCVVTPTPSGSDKTKEQARLEVGALGNTEACCVVVEQVQQLSETSCLNALTRKKVKMLVFHGERCDVATKAIGILFPHLRESDVIFRPETENIHQIAERILTLASAT